MRNIRLLIVSVTLIVVGIGVMHMVGDSNLANTVGGGVFVVGLIVLSLTLFNMLHDNDGNKKKNA